MTTVGSCWKYHNPYFATPPPKKEIGFTAFLWEYVWLNLWHVMRKWVRNIIIMISIVISYQWPSLNHNNLDGSTTWNNWKTTSIDPRWPWLTVTLNNWIWLLLTQNNLDWPTMTLNNWQWYWPTHNDLDWPTATLSNRQRPRLTLTVASREPDTTTEWVKSTEWTTLVWQGWQRREHRPVVVFIAHTQPLLDNTSSTHYQHISIAIIKFVIVVVVVKVIGWLHFLT